MGTTDQMAVYEWVNISDDLVYEWIRFFYFIFSKDPYMSGVGFKILEVLIEAYRK